MRGTNSAAHPEEVRWAPARALGAARAAAAATALCVLSWGSVAASQPAASQPASPQAAAQQPAPAEPPPAGAGDAQAAPSPPGQGPPAGAPYPMPYPGGPPPWVQQPQPYSVEAYDHYIRAARERLEAAKERDDDQEVKRLKEEIKALERGREEAFDRTTERRSVGMMAGGIVLVGVGGAGILTASVLGVSAALSNRGSQKDNLYAGALVSVSLGLVCLGAGIPLAIVGGKRVPKGEGASGPVLLVGPQSAGLRWQF